MAITVIFFCSPRIMVMNLYSSANDGIVRYGHEDDVPFIMGWFIGIMFIATLQLWIKR